uniref:Interleukin-1 receptor accessory protein n=1 Tax=Ornithorhynchus anatinus TaxID=9258 RepID=A0A6I8NEX9_ORNAN
MPTVLGRTPAALHLRGPRETGLGIWPEGMDLFCFLVTFWLCVTLQSGSSERCEDWGLDTMTKIQVYDGEPACIKCPLFEQFLKYNYSTAHSAGLTLIWYWIGQDRDLEEPINFRLPDNRISKEKDILWFRPTLLNDTGNYTCMLRNTTYCSKVAFPLEVVRKDPGKCVSPLVKPLVKLLYEEEDLQFINCPNIDGFYPVNLKPVVHWFKGCKEVNNFHSVFPNGTSLDFTTARSSINGIYTCIVNYLDGGRTFSLTRSVEVKVVGHPDKALPPQMLSPMDQVVYEKEPGEELLLPCEVIFTFLKDSPKEIWWTIDGKKTDDIPDITVNQSIITSQIEDITIKKTLNIKKVSSDDLKRNYTCHARNAKGKVEKQAKVKQKEPLLVIPVGKRGKEIEYQRHNQNGWRGKKKGEREEEKVRKRGLGLIIIPGYNWYFPNHINLSHSPL